ncbi:ABC transporter substrate-binding protein [Tenacibaculum sp. 190524A02b]|uniref:Iron complex transport system substrate-binding protein n=1 Tax=Tenacibaculum vairaonense TaxID=3137860 RepID=A0ABM9PGW4_9FLAO
MKPYFLSVIALFFLLQCKKAPKKVIKTNNVTKTVLKYAKGFDIITENNQKKLVLKRMFPNSNKQLSLIIGSTTNLSKQIIKTPINKLVVTSTTHIPMLELLGCENRLVGFPHTKYISSKKTRNRIKNGHIVELGSEQNINTEKLIDLAPELVIGFSLHPNNKVYENVKKTGIPVVFNGDWLEETPLGRAEWIKFFGVLLQKEKEADSIFNVIESAYLKAKNIASKNTYTPTVLSGSMYKDVWNVPAGESFKATYFKDANLNYIWKNTKGTGSLQLSFESVLEKGKKANYWINCGSFTTKEQMLTANINYKEFDAFKNNRLYTFAHKKGETGGTIYYEMAPIRPDLVLKDLVKMINPDLLPNYELTFYDKVE